MTLNPRYLGGFHCSAKPKVRDTQCKLMSSEDILLSHWTADLRSGIPLLRALLRHTSVLKSYLTFLGRIQQNRSTLNKNFRLIPGSRMFLTGAPFKFADLVSMLSVPPVLPR